MQRMETKEQRFAREERNVSIGWCLTVAALVLVTAAIIVIAFKSA